MTGTRVPDAIAPSTKGCPRRPSTTPRTTRDIRGISASVMATTTFPIDPLVSAMSAIASRMGGMLITASITRMTTASTSRPRNPEIRPIARPMSEAAVATEKPTIKETRAP